MNKLYQVVDDKDFLIVYITTTSKRLATNALKELKKMNSKYANFKIITPQLLNKKPLFTWLFFADEFDDKNIVDICVEEPESNYDVSWSDTACYKIEAYTLKEAKKLLFTLHGAKCED